MLWYAYEIPGDLIRIKREEQSSYGQLHRVQWTDTLTHDNAKAFTLVCALHTSLISKFQNKIA